MRFCTSTELFLRSNEDMLPSKGYLEDQKNEKFGGRSLTYKYIFILLSLHLLDIYLTVKNSISVLDLWLCSTEKILTKHECKEMIFTKEPANENGL